MKNLKQNPNPSPEDETFWSEITGEVKKIKQPVIAPAKKVVLKEVVPTIRMNEVYQGNTLDELGEGDLADIDGSMAKRFKRGEFRIEAELDLHGYTEERAYGAVEEFIKRAYLQNKRCVLIITGKGMVHDDNRDIFSSKGLLKERVPQWLNRPELRPLILSFRHPDIKQGGSGSLCILLRRQR